MIWTNWVAGGNAVLIMAAGVVAFARPWPSMPRTLKRCTGLFLICFGAVVLVSNAGWIATVATDNEDWVSGARAAAAVIGLIGQAFLLAFAFRMAEFFNRALAWTTSILIVLVGLVFAAWPALVFGSDAPLYPVAASLHLLILPAAAGVMFLQRLNIAEWVDEVARQQQLTWISLGFVPYLVYQGAMAFFDFPSELLPAVVVVLGGLLVAAFLVCAFVVLRRHAKMFAIVGAVGVGAVTAALSFGFLELSALWAAVSRDLVASGILVAFCVHLESFPEAAPKPKAATLRPGPEVG